MKFIDFFAGIGGFRRGLELSGHICVGFCEWDKFAAASYILEKPIAMKIFMTKKILSLTEWDCREML